MQVQKLNDAFIKELNNFNNGRYTIIYKFIQRQKPLPDEILRGLENRALLLGMDIKIIGSTILKFHSSTGVLEIEADGFSYEYDGNYLLAYCRCESLAFENVDLGNDITALFSGVDLDVLDISGLNLKTVAIADKLFEKCMIHKVVLGKQELKFKSMNSMFNDATIMDSTIFSKVKFDRAVDCRDLYANLHIQNHNPNSLKIDLCNNSEITADRMFYNIRAVDVTITNLKAKGMVKMFCRCRITGELSLSGDISDIDGVNMCLMFNNSYMEYLKIDGLEPNKNKSFVISNMLNGIDVREITGNSAWWKDRLNMEYTRRLLNYESNN